MKTNFFKIALLALLLGAGTQMTYTMQDNPFNAAQEYDSLIGELKLILHKHNYPTLSTAALQTNLYFTILDNYCRTQGTAFAEQMYPEYYPKVRQCDQSRLIFRNTFLQSCLGYFALTGIYIPAPTSPVSTHSLETQRATPVQDIMKYNQMTPLNDLAFADSCMNFDPDIVELVKE